MKSRPETESNKSSNEETYFVAILGRKYIEQGDYILGPVPI